MPDWLHKLLRNGVIYTLGNSLTALLPLLLLPLLTKSLTPLEYSEISVFQIYIFILTPLVGLESVSAVSRAYFERDVQLSEYINTAFLLVVGSGLAIALLILLSMLADLKFGVSSRLALLAVAYCVLLYPFSVLANLKINEGKPFDYVLLNLLFFTANVLLVVILFFKMNRHDATLRIGPMLGASFICGVLALHVLFLRGYLSIKPGFKCLKKIGRYSAPLVVHAFAGALLGSGPILVMKAMGEEVQIGYYSIALTFGSLISILAVGLNKAVAPWLLDAYEHDRRVLIRYRRMGTFASLGVLLIFPIYLLLESTVVDLLGYVIDTRYLEYRFHMKWVVIGFLLNAIYLIFVNILFCWKATASLAAFTVVSAALGLSVSFVAATHWGVQSVGAGMAFSFLSLAFLVFYSTRNVNALTP
jgi:O-antigen/teichoic acid export membrane protein